MREIYPPPFGHPLLHGGTVLRTFSLVKHRMGEISSPSFGHPLFQGGALIRTFPLVNHGMGEISSPSDAPFSKVGRSFGLFPFWFSILQTSLLWMRFFYFSCSKFDLRSIFCFLLVFLLFSSAVIPFFQFLCIFYAYF